MLELTVQRRFDGLVDDWDDLARAVGAPPFLHPGWFRAWWNAFGATDPRRHLRIVTVRDGHALTGVLPLYREGRTLRSLGNLETPVFGPVARDEAAVAAIARHVAAAPVDLVDLDRLDPDSVFSRWWKHEAGLHRRLIHTPVMNSPYTDVSTTWDAYLDAHPRARRLAAKTARTQRRLEEEHGTVSFDVDSTAERLDDALELEASGWKGQAGSAILCDPATTRFYRAVADWAIGRGTFRLLRLSAHGRLAAFQYGLEFDGVFHSIKVGHDEELRRFGPGVLLYRHSLQHHMNPDAFRRYEFLGADEADKQRWADGLHPRVRVRAYASTMTAALPWMWVTTLRPRLKAARDVARERWAARAHRASDTPTPDRAAS